MSNVRISSIGNWRFLISILLPLFLAPITFLGGTETESKIFKCGYTILVMGVFWMLEVLPLSITALFPIVFFPVFGIQSTGQVVANYMKETQMMFIGGISLALALKYSGLHKRFALRIMILIGCSPWRLLLGILVTTTLLSCVIVINTAVAAMMLPIVSGLVESLGTTMDDKRRKKLRIVFMLAVGYGANIGGTATLIGSQPNLIYKELIETQSVGQDGKYLDLNFFTFFAYSMPIALVNLTITWLVLGSLYLGRPARFQSARIRGGPPTNDSNVKSLLKTKYAELGRMGFHEVAVLSLLSLAVLLWLTRDPQVFRGWFSLFPPGNPKIGDPSVGIATLLLMFIIPRKLKYFKRNYKGKAETLLTWDYIQLHFPWSVIFIVGGGLAISSGADASGLSAWLGQQLTTGLRDLPTSLILFVLLIAISLFTEFMSNAATVSLLTPILITLSKDLDIHPLYLTLPGAIACQYAFVLPTSNPPNAVVFSAGGMRIVDMAKTGLILNFLCVSILFVLNLTWGEYFFNYSNYVYPNVTRDIGRLWGVDGRGKSS